MCHGEDLVEAEIRREIFWGDSHSPRLFFFLSMIPLSFMFRKINARYEWRKKNITKSFVVLG